MEMLELTAISSSLKHPTIFPTYAQIVEIRAQPGLRNRFPATDKGRRGES